MLKQNNYINNDNLNVSFMKNFRQFHFQLQFLKNQSHKKILIYGAGTVGEFIYYFLKDQTIAFIDKNVDTLNKTIDNLPIYSPDMLSTLDYDMIIVSSLGHEEVLINELNLTYSIDRNKILTFNIMQDTLNETKEISKVLDRQKAFSQQKTFVQIGASEGSLARKFALDGWKAYGFDANPKYLKDFENQKDIKDLHLFNQAISIHDEKKVTFYISDDHEGIGSLKSYHKTHTPIEVEAISLQEFYKNKNINAIDFFMIDAETMDLDIMKTHDWDIPINSLLMECTRNNVLEIKDYILKKIPSYNYVVFAHEKPIGIAGEKGYCRGTVSAECFSNLPRNRSFFGNIFFWRETD